MRAGEILKYGGNIRELFGAKHLKPSNTDNDDVIAKEDSDVAEERKCVANLASGGNEMVSEIRYKLCSSNITFWVFINQQLNSLAISLYMKKVKAS